MQCESSFNKTLNYYITFLARTLPPRSIPTFIELLFGAMISTGGFVTEAYLAIEASRHWNTYYKWLQQGCWSWLKLARQLLRLIERCFSEHWRFLVIDDSLVYRLSHKAPGSCIQYDHSNKGNRPTYVRGQCWVCLGVILGPLKRLVGIPILARLSDETGQPSKLRIAQQLLRAVSQLLPTNAVLLLDSWYMKSPLIHYAQQQGLTVIGQARKDLALFGKPTPQQGRGRPRKYGDRIHPNQLSWQCLRGHFYGRHQRIWYRSCQAKARFLKGQWVRAVWCYFENKQGELNKPRLLVSTDPNCHPADVIMAYARRFYIEPVFDDVKNRWGWKETWQQTRQTLHRWLHILFVSYAIPKLLTLAPDAIKQEIAFTSPWRPKIPQTAGQIRQGLVRIFRHFRVRDGWDRKSQEFHIPQWLEKIKKPPSGPQVA